MTSEIFDLSPYKPRGDRSLLELNQILSKADLYRLTDEIIAAERAIVADASDSNVIFVPIDPAIPDNPNQIPNGWPIAHTIVHAHATSEESAALALLMARGAAIPPDVRTRYEIPWETVTTIAQVIARLAESQRMRRAMLDAWPDVPHLDLIQEHPFFGSFNAIGRFMAGLGHEIGHLDQLRETMQQAIAARVK